MFLFYPMIRSKSKEINSVKMQCWTAATNPSLAAAEFLLIFNRDWDYNYFLQFLLTKLKMLPVSPLCVQKNEESLNSLFHNGVLNCVSFVNYNIPLGYFPFLMRDEALKCLDSCWWKSLQPKTWFLHLIVNNDLGKTRSNILTGTSEDWVCIHTLRADRTVLLITYDPGDQCDWYGMAFGDWWQSSHG